jgi:hypothetical protein
MATTKTNPLDSFKSSTTTTNDFRIKPMPKLSSFLGNMRLTEAVQAHEEALEEWRQQLERQVNERLQPKAPLPPGNV